MHWKLKLQKEFYVKFMKQIYFNNIEPKKNIIVQFRKKNDEYACARIYRRSDI